MTVCSASASVSVEALTLSIRPLLPWVPLFQASILPSSSSDWVDDQHRPFDAHIQMRTGDDDGDLQDAFDFGVPGRSFRSRARRGSGPISAGTGAVGRVSDMGAIVADGLHSRLLMPADAPFLSLLRWP